MKKLVIGIIIVGAIALIVGFVPLREVAYTIEKIEPLSFEVKGFCKKEQRPGSSFVRSTVAFSKDPALVSKALTESYKQVPVGYVMVQNTDTVPGIFDVRITFYTQGKEFTHEETLKLRPDELETISYYATWKTDMPFNVAISADRDEWSWDYKVTPNTKTVRKTLYEKVTLLDYWFHY